MKYFKWKHKCSYTVYEQAYFASILDIIYYNFFFFFFFAVFGKYICYYLSYSTKLLQYHEPLKKNHPIHIPSFGWDLV